MKNNSTPKKNHLQKHAAKHSVAVLISDNLGLFEFGIAVEIFGLDRPEFDFPWYELGVVSAQNKTVTTTTGIRVTGDHDLSYLEQCDTIIIPSWSSAEDAQSNRVNAALQTAFDRGARILSICSGVFLLASAGLINDRKATTHWKHIPRLKDLYPAIEIEVDSIYIDHGNIICSAGSSAGIDACMHLVRRDFGNKVANDVARRLVSHPHRIGGQKQFIHNPVEARDKHTIGTVMEWCLQNLKKKITVKSMAAQVHMSERTFLRHFSKTTGKAPVMWLQEVRIARAKELLESTDHTHEAIAEQTGYQSIETFRVAFKRVTGVTVGAYRFSFKFP